MLSARETFTNPSAEIALSFVLCSRNDSYMGNSMWRLETTLNYLARQVKSARRGEDVEVIVADWGSEHPLLEHVPLSDDARNLVTFLTIPPNIATDLQKDSPFPEVLALNAAVRRARGSYIARIDQDTLVSQNFLATFFGLLEGRLSLSVPLHKALMFSNLRMMPYRLTVRSPPLDVVSNTVERWGARMQIECTSGRPFYAHSVGVWTLHRKIWHACGGYDERMIYMNQMEVNMINRLRRRDYQVLDLGPVTRYGFYHLEHYHPYGLRKSGTHRKDNPRWLRDDTQFAPNGPNWGLADHSLSLQRQVEGPASLASCALCWTALSVPIVLTQMAADKLVVRGMQLQEATRMHCRRWARRAGIVVRALASEPPRSWLRLVRQLRESRVAGRKRQADTRMSTKETI